MLAKVSRIRLRYADLGPGPNEYTYLLAPEFFAAIPRMLQCRISGFQEKALARLHLCRLDWRNPKEQRVECLDII